MVNKGEEGLDKYSIEKWQEIMNVTQMNYSNMLRRLEIKSKISNYILIYYSIFLITISLACKYFPDKFDNSFVEYFNIMLSVIVLAYSLINDNANYRERIVNIEKSLNEVKDIRRKLDDNNFRILIRDYNDIVNKTEKREDRDFYHTINQLKEKYRSIEEYGNSDEQYEKQLKRWKKKVNDYLSEVNKIYIRIEMAIEFVWHILLFVTPIIIMLFSMYRTKV